MARVQMSVLQRQCRESESHRQMVQVKASPIAEGVAFRAEIPNLPRRSQGNKNLMDEFTQVLHDIFGCINIYRGSTPLRLATATPFRTLYPSERPPGEFTQLASTKLKETSCSTGSLNPQKVACLPE